MDYLLKSSAVLFIFYLCYQLLLQRDTFFQTNRWFLLSGLVIASSIPFIIIPNYIEYTPIISETNYNYAISNNSAISTIINEDPLNYRALLSWIYISGILFFFGKLAIEFLSLKKVLNNSHIKSTGAFKLMETHETIAPFSFFNRIVYNPNQFKDEELTHVINHEKVHAREWHSVDTIVAQIACILFWFNPIVWLYKKALQQNLEFIADQKAQYISACEKSYQTVLLKASVQNHQLAFTNNFYTSLIKKRIIMLHKSKSNKLNQLKITLILPLLAVFLMSFNIKDVYVETATEDSSEQDTSSKNKGTSESGDIEIVFTKNTSDEELKTIQKQLEDKGITFTYDALKRNNNDEIISIHTQFKSADHSSNYNISGDESIKEFRFKSSKDFFGVGTFDLTKDSYVLENTDRKTKTKVSGSNIYIFETDDNEENDHIKTDTKTYTFISSPTKKIKVQSSGSNDINLTKSEEPLFIIDGKVVKKSLFEDVDSEDIESIDVFKGKAAIETYGSKGKNGVIIMKKKDSNSRFQNSDSKNNFKLESHYSDQPLFIVDGRQFNENQFRNLDPNNIESIEVIKDKKAKNAYGERGKNGVIVVKTKELQKSLFLIKEGNETTIEVEDNNPWEIKTEVTSVYFEDDNGNIYFEDNNGKESVEFIISKHSTDAFIEQQKKALKEHGIDAKINKIRRNKAGEITSIKISLDDNKGQKSSASWKEKSQAIPDIVLGKSGDKLMVRTIGD